MKFIFSLNLIKPFILFYVIGVVILFVIYRNTIRPQDGGFGMYDLFLIVFALIILLNGFYNIYLGFSTKNTIYFGLAFMHITVVVGGVLLLAI